jgi:response regulator of citrate/malate metabolism
MRIKLYIWNAYNYFYGVDDSFTKDDITAKVGISKATVVECLEYWYKKKILKLSADGYFSLVEE